MKTPVQELIEMLESVGWKLHEDTKTEFLEKEKQHIIEAVKYGFNDSIKPQCCQDLSFEQYYKETFS